MKIKLFLIPLALFAAACTRSDRSIEEDVAMKIHYIAPDITMSSKEGVVHLSGVVNSDSIKHAAENAATETRGVKGVENKLIVVPKPAGH